MLGAALASGPCALTLTFFLALQAGLPHGVPLALGVVVVLLVVAGLAWRRWPPAAQPFAEWIGPALIAAIVAGLLLVRGLEVPTPDGDGLFSFGLKARGIHETGEVGPILRHPDMRVVHTDYPLHVPLLMDMGFLFGGDVSGWNALVGSLLVFPGVILFLGCMAARRSRLAGLVVALLTAFAPVFHTFAVSGYADPALMAAFTIAALLVIECGTPGAAAGLAVGLLPWVKHEGLVLLGLLLAVACLRRKPPWSFLLVALLVGSIWRISLLALGIEMPMTEDLPESGAWGRLVEILQHFGLALVDPEGIFALAWVPVVLACVFCLRDRQAGSNRQTASVVLLCLVGFLVLALLRRPASHLVTSGDVPTRIYLQILPLGMYVLGTEIVRRLGLGNRGTAGPAEPGTR
jgi:hypothetical protein